MKRIVWDERKNKIDQTKHRVRFEDAADVFFDPLSLSVDDSDVVFYTEFEEEIGIISAGRPTRTERLPYEEGMLISAKASEESILN
jgi:uncharacterized DUF497 family protein